MNVKWAPTLVRLTAFAAIVVTTVLLGGCQPAGIAEVKVIVDTQVRRELPIVWMGPGDVSPLPRLRNSDWNDLAAGGKVTTDQDGEAWLDISDCLRIYLFQDSQLVKAACPKSTYTGGNVTCSLAGTGVYNNACSSQVVLQTLSADVVLEGTWVMLTYLPKQQLTVVVVAEGEADVWPVIDFDSRETTDRPITVHSQELLFTSPDDKLHDIAGLPPRVPLPLVDVYPLVEELGLEEWLDRVIDRADVDDVPFPEEAETPKSTITPTRRPTSVPTHTPTRRPTSAPTHTPTRRPTSAPTHTPTPTKQPTRTPTRDVRGQQEPFVVQGAGGPLEDFRVDQSIAIAVDWSALLEHIFPEYAPHVTLFLPSLVTSTSKEPFDPDHARELLYEADYPEGFDVVIVAEEKNEFMAAAEWMSAQLTEVGLRPEFTSASRRQAPGFLAELVAEGLPVLWLGSEIDLSWRENLPEPTSEPVARVRVHVSTSSDWTNVFLPPSGDITETETIETSGDLSFAFMEGATLSIAQDLGRAKTGYEIGMTQDIAYASLPASDTYTVGLEKGCIGFSDVEVFNMQTGSPVLIGRLATDNCNEDFVLPIDRMQLLSSNPAPPRRTPLHISVTTDADWTTVTLPSNGVISEQRTLGVEGDTTYAFLREGVIQIGQELDNALEGASVMMAHEVVFADWPQNQDMTISVNRGCIGETTVTIFNPDIQAVVGQFVTEHCDEEAPYTFNPNKP